MAKTETTRRKPKRIRRVLSITLHPTAIDALDKRAALLGCNRSQMIERLALAHCREDDGCPEVALTVRWNYGLGFEVEQATNIPTVAKR